MTQKLKALTLHAPHGIKGEFKCYSHFEDLDVIRDAKVLFLSDGKQLTLKKITQKEKTNIVSFEELADRTAAEKFRSQDLFIDEQFLPEIEDDESFYIEDLIGMKAYLQDGSLYGEVETVWDFGAGDILEIAPAAGGSSIMLPFRFDFVPEIDPEQHRITIILPNFV